MRIQTKICGVSTSEAVTASIGHGAAWLGFMMFAKSPRYVTADQAASLSAPMPGHVGKVAVLVDPDDELVGRAIGAGMKILQLHGHESPERVVALRRSTGAEIWKVISVRTAADLAGAAAYRGAADRILYDAKTPDGAALPGGMGLRFDWNLLAGFDHPLPWALSGGLDATSVAEAVAISGASAVDVSSGVESAPGVKDVDKIAAFLQATGRL
ncbi:phosphoribosylanthranilate isomerase [Sphingomonas sp. BIUV-7]|uniref:N-(5'-phosphoribosyl)anthranilate isomerase n=1 Tax=Sphingomonas natans TaxID=3063330 RepID=A0ABT8YDM6_9SPHN|nr:phosphoribosylanthranilate isomerase [Sphingomonas sp. BIUV-7]MDO6415888.1 phosphoribosylanthranilate isomerase [Sphingomonas sp. BIUV-7]